MFNQTSLPEKWLRWFKSQHKSTRLTTLLIGLAGLFVLGSFIIPHSGQQEDSVLVQGIDVTIKLAIVIILIYLSAYLLRKWGLTSFQRPSHEMSIRETLPLSPRRALYWIKVGQKNLLIGATDQSVTLISELQSSEEQNPKINTLVLEPVALKNNGNDSEASAAINDMEHFQHN